MNSVICAKTMEFAALNKAVRQAAPGEITLQGCLGQRYIGDGLGEEKSLVIQGVPGNGLGAYLNGARITVEGNAQDATGDTMNGGMILVRGSAGDATGYAMRGGKIYIGGDTGYRAGIHMKAYQEKQPLLVIGGCAGSFLGEYQAGGVIVVLGLNAQGKVPVNYFCGTGMHGGVIYLRSRQLPKDLPPQVAAREADEADQQCILAHIGEYCKLFDLDAEEIVQANFYVLTPNTQNPYHRLYTYN